MKKVFLLTMLVFFAFASIAFAADKQLYLHNKSAVNIISVDVSPDGGDEWISLYKSKSGIKPGDSMTLRFDRKDIVKWRLSIETDKEGEGDWTWDIDMKKNSRLTFSYDQDDDGWLEWR